MLLEYRLALLPQRGGLRAGLLRLALQRRLPLLGLPLQGRQFLLLPALPLRRLLGVGPPRLCQLPVQLLPLGLPADARLLVAAGRGVAGCGRLRLGPFQLAELRPEQFGLARATIASVSLSEATSQRNPSARLPSSRSRAAARSAPSRSAMRIAAPRRASSSATA